MKSVCLRVWDFHKWVTLIMNKNGIILTVTTAIDARIRPPPPAVINWGALKHCVYMNCYVWPRDNVYKLKQNNNV